MIIQVIKNVIYNITPPILYKIVKFMFHLKRPSLKPPIEIDLTRQYHEIAPDGWNTNLSNNVNGWDDQKVVETEISRWGNYCRNLDGTGPLGFSHEHNDLGIIRSVPFHNVHMTFAYVVTLTAHHKNKISILDIGSGLGHYYRLAKAVLPNVEFDYHCVDVPSLVSEGKKLNPEIHWYTNNSYLDHPYDLVMINGSMQYFKDWAQIIKQVSVVTKDYLLLTRINVVKDGMGCVAIQHIPAYGTSMLFQIFTEHEIIKTVEETGIRLIRELVVGDQIKVIGFLGSIESRGWLFRRFHD